MKVTAQTLNAKIMKMKPGIWKSFANIVYVGTGTA